MVTTSSDELAERLFGSLLGFIDVVAVHLGDRLGWYRSLVDDGPASAPELARRTGTHPRYAREWLEQQAVAGYLTVEQEGDPDERVFAIPEATAEVMTDGASLNHLAPFARMFAAVGPTLPQLLEAYRTGGGVSWEQLGADARESQADGNRPWYDLRLATALADVPQVHDVLSRPGASVLDVGAGGGWSTIALARAYPEARVEAVDIEINGESATGLTGTGAGPYVFTFRQPEPGTVNVAWEFDHGIAGTGGTGAFVPSGPWTYTLLDTIPPDLQIDLSESGALPPGIVLDDLALRVDGNYYFLQLDPTVAEAFAEGHLATLQIPGGGGLLAPGSTVSLWYRFKDSPFVSCTTSIAAE